MKIRVVYHSKTGNTRKVAEAIGKAVGAPAVPITDNINFDSVDILFIGDGVYGSNCDKATRKLIKSLDSNKVRSAAVFGTYGGMKSGIEKMKKLLKEQGINVVEETYGCRGRSWVILNRKHPNTDDIKAAEKFARKVAGRK